MTADETTGANPDPAGTDPDAVMDDADIDRALESLPGIGEVGLDETGLSLPVDLGDGTGDGAGGSVDTSGTGVADDPDARPPRPVTAADLEELREVEAELTARWPETRIDPTLDRISALMDLLGSPQRSYQSIHVAGTNGKTSVVRMIESLLRAFHRRTGRTTSPHLQLPTERIAVDGVPLHPRDYVATWREIQPFVEMVDARSEAAGGPRMSTFEVLVGMAYAAFADAPVDVAVVEVGMGGRWDATNVIDADVSVITPVGLDHTDYLGDTIAAIAGEKAGIISSRWDTDDLLSPPDTVAVVAEQEPEAMEVILRQAVEADAAVAREGSEFGVVESTVAVGGQQLTLRGLGGTYTDIVLPLSGEHQARNAALALAAVEAFFGAGANRQLDVDTVRRGFAQVRSPGRLERVRSAPSVFIDATHNPHGARALAKAVDRDFSFRRLVGVVGVLSDKDARGILAELEPVMDEVVVTQSTSPRALDVETLAEYARDAFGEERVHVAPLLPGAVELATQLAEDDGGDGMVSGAGVLITGSVVTAGEARTLFGKEPA
ncbi:bifunctional tetrahydrofolate synthase/dihydrofolate synthase [Corynebacterium bovis]